MSREITNEDRIWYVMFVLWCTQQRKDYTVEDQNQPAFRSMPDHEWQKFYEHASFEVLVTGKCPACWYKDFNEAKIVTLSGNGWAKCPKCEIKVATDAKKRRAVLSEEE